MGLSNAELLCQDLLRYATSGVAPADYCYLGISEFGKWIAFALIEAIKPRRIAVPCSRASLRSAVPVVVQICTQEEVVRTNAGWSVAVMENCQAFGDLPIVQSPRVSVRAFISAVQLKTPVTITTNASGPEPTGIRLLDILPKALLWRWRICGRAFTAPTHVVHRAETTTATGATQRTSASVNRTNHGPILTHGAYGVAV